MLGGFGKGARLRVGPVREPDSSSSLYGALNNQWHYFNRLLFALVVAKLEILVILNCPGVPDRLQRWRLRRACPRRIRNKTGSAHLSTEMETEEEARGISRERERHTQRRKRRIRTCTLGLTAMSSQGLSLCVYGVGFGAYAFHISKMIVFASECWASII